MGTVIVIMGVSGTGKTTVGRMLARATGGEFVDADNLHSPENVAKMRSGTPLTDDDRAQWLATVRDRIALLANQPGPAFVACSALKNSYRAVLRERTPGLQFVFLHGDRDLLSERLNARTGHYMPASLLQSQLLTLEPPGPGENAIALDVSPSPDQLAESILASLRSTKKRAGTQGPGSSSHTLDRSA